MKVLNISNDYAYTQLYEKFHLSLINEGVNSVFLVPAPTNTTLEIDDPNIHVLPSYKQWLRPLFLIKNSFVIKKLYQYFDNNFSSFDVVHAHYLFSAGILAKDIKNKFGLPYIVAVRNTDVNYIFRKMVHLRKVGVSILKEANKIVFLSESYKQSTIKYIPDELKESILDKSVVIPNGIDEFWLNNLYFEKRVCSEKEIKFLQVGEITGNKNYITTAQALESLKENGFDPTLNIVGKILDKKIYEKLITYEFVKYHGVLPKEELLGLYRANDIFILPSIHETFGLVYAEAMSQGLPVIYSKGQGFDQQFEEGVVGYHVWSQSTDDIVEAVKLVIENYEKLSENCIKMVAKFSWSAISCQYSNVYKRIIKRL